MSQMGLSRPPRRFTAVVNKIVSQQHTRVPPTSQKRKRTLEKEH